MLLKLFKPNFGLSFLYVFMAKSSSWIFLRKQSNKLTLGFQGDAKPSAAQALQSRTGDREQEILRIAL